MVATLSCRAVKVVHTQDYNEKGRRAHESKTDSPEAKLPICLRLICRECEGFKPMTLRIVWNLAKTAGLWRSVRLYRVVLARGAPRPRPSTTSARPWSFGSRLSWRNGQDHCRRTPRFLRLRSNSNGTHTRRRRLEGLGLGRRRDSAVRARPTHH